MSWATMRVASGALLCALAVAACGGDVVVDDKPTGATGSGGSGASSGGDDDGSSADGDDGSSDGDTGPSTTGGTTGPTGATSGTGTSSGSGSGSGSGGAGPEACASCATNAVNGQCSELAMQCTQDEQCAKLLACHSGCGFELDCIGGCDASQPGGHELLYELMGCVACASCIQACSGQPLNNYCLLQ